MDLLTELNSLADVAHSVDLLEPFEDTTKRWQELFSYGAEEAHRLILEHRSDLTISLVPEDLWRIAQISGEVSGHDRESYTHFLKTSRHRCFEISSMDTSRSDEEYLIKLEGQILSAEKLQRVASLNTTPPMRTGISTAEDEKTPANFCIVNSSTKSTIQQWFAKQHLPPPNIILISIAPKSFSDISMTPMLGTSTTLPQHRMENCDSIPRPRQDEYPVWYFFYGTLQDPEMLRTLFEGSESDEYD